MSDRNTAYRRTPELASPGDSRLLVIDAQERLMPHIHAGDRVIANCRRLLEGAKLLDVPRFATEQYPKGLGPTVPALRGFFDVVPEKLRFSAAEALGWPTAATESRHRVILAGVEAHVCVQQTVLDLIAMGYRVMVVADAVSSRSETDARIALDRMALAGAVVTTSEAILFEWCEVAGTDAFRSISRLVK